jgi:hypothetical protein
VSGIVLRAESLTSKWGFGDGDTLQDHLYDLQDSNSPWPGEEKFEMPDRDDILHKVVEKFLLPTIKAKGVDVNIYVIVSNHNPVRARAVNGEDVTDFDTDSNYEHPLLVGIEVEVTNEQLLECLNG